MSITSSRHPDYLCNQMLWKKFRYTFESGQDFIDEYLKYFSHRETYADYIARKAVTYCPSYAKAELLKIKNALYQRMVDITRLSEIDSYNKAVQGLNKGVDRNNASMTGFIGNEVLPELLFMGKVGVYVDRARLPVSPSLIDTSNSTPYLYIYKAEDILSWSYDDDNQLNTLLLMDHGYKYDDEGLINGEQSTYRFLKKTAEGINVSLYGTDNVISTSYTLALDTMPFAVFELSESLLTDVANYQIALLNMASADTSYSLRANYPFYTEQYDPKVAMAQMLSGPAYDENGDAYNPGSEAEANASKFDEIKTGANTGRRYPKDMERPDFIHPSSEPLKASMDKQEKMQQEIRDLVHLTLQNVSGTSSDTLHSGMSNISMELEQGERQIAAIWAGYEGVRNDIVIKYPHSFSLKTEEERQEEATKLEEHIAKTPSTLLKKELAKKIADILISAEVSQDNLDEIHQEINNAQVIVLDPEVIKADHEAGFVSTELASTLRGYPAGQVEQAKTDHIERLERIAIAQSDASQARGIADAGEPDDGRREKEASRMNDQDDVATDKTRGEAANV